LDLETFKGVSKEETKELLDDIEKLNKLFLIIRADIKKGENPKLYRDNWSYHDDD